MFAVKQTKTVYGHPSGVVHRSTTSFRPLHDSFEVACGKVMDGSVVEWLLNNEEAATKETDCGFFASVINEAEGTNTTFSFTLAQFDTINEYFDLIQKNSGAKRSISPKDVFQMRGCC